MTRDQRLSAVVCILIVVGCCFLDVDCEDSEGDKVTFNKEQDAKIQDAKTKLLTVTNIAEGMSSSSHKMMSPKNFQGKLQAAKTKVQNIEKKLLGEKDAEGKAERITGALSGVGEGLIGIIQGYKDGDWVQAVQGALGMITSVVALAGPIGMVASSIMSLVSGFLGLFGGSQPESQESMIKRVIEAAINDFRHKDLKEEIEGAKHVYRSLSNSIQNFREERQISTSQAEELYNHAFRSLEVFGKLKTRIRELCEKPKDSQAAKTCLDFVQLYAELSILRQLILADMASLLSEPEINLEGTGNNILHMIKQEQISDQAIVAPFADPLNNPDHRRAISYLFGTPEKYALLYTYMKTLHDSLDGGVFKDMVVVCNERLLGDFCVPMEETEYPKLSEQSLNNVITSAFIPKGKQLRAWDKDGFQGHEYGPFVGRVVHGLVAGFDTWKSLKIETTNENIDEQVRFCEKEGMDPYELCDSMKEIAGNEQFNEMINYHGTNWVKKTIRSLYVPTGLLVHGAQFGDGGGGHSFGTIFGPQLVSKICYPTEKRFSHGLSVKGIKGFKNIVDGSPIDARKMVQFCDENDLQGYCIRDQRSRSELRDDVYGCRLDKKIKSMKVPGGLKVTGYKERDHKDRRYGPYIGSVILNTVDAPGTWRSYKIEVIQDIKSNKGGFYKIQKTKHVKRLKKYGKKLKNYEENMAMNTSSEQTEER